MNEIQSLTMKKGWTHVPGDLNASGLPSRECSLRVFLSSRSWEGPSWLKQSEEEWPKTEA